MTQFLWATRQRLPVSAILIMEHYINQRVININFKRVFALYMFFSQIAILLANTEVNTEYPFLSYFVALFLLTFILGFRCKNVAQCLIEHNRFMQILRTSDLRQYSLGCF